jgi:hypothetical protein
MRRVREVLRLRHALGMSDRSIAQSLGIGKTTVGEYVCRAKVIGITWPVPEEIDDAELERRLFTAPSFEKKPKRPPLDWPRLHEELKRRGVTLMLLWLEYRANEQRASKWHLRVRPYPRHPLGFGVHFAPVGEKLVVKNRAARIVGGGPSVCPRSWPAQGRRGLVPM